MRIYTSTFTKDDGFMDINHVDTFVNDKYLAMQHVITHILLKESAAVDELEFKNNAYSGDENIIGELRIVSGTRRATTVIYLCESLEKARQATIKAVDNQRECFWNSASDKHELMTMTDTEVW